MLNSKALGAQVGGGDTAPGFTAAANLGIAVAKPVRAVIVSGILESVCCPAELRRPFWKAADRFAVPYPLWNDTVRFGPGSTVTAALVVQSFPTVTRICGTGS